MIKEPEIKRSGIEKMRDIHRQCQEEQLRLSESFSVNLESSILRSSQASKTFYEVVLNAFENKIKSVLNGPPIDCKEAYELSRTEGGIIWTFDLATLMDKEAIEFWINDACEKIASKVFDAYGFQFGNILYSTRRIGSDRTQYRVYFVPEKED